MHTPHCGFRPTVLPSLLPLVISASKIDRYLSVFCQCLKGWLASSGCLKLGLAVMAPAMEETKGGRASSHYLQCGLSGRWNIVDECTEWSLWASMWFHAVHSPPSPFFLTFLHPSQPHPQFNPLNAFVLCTGIVFFQRSLLFFFLTIALANFFFFFLVFWK